MKLSVQRSLTRIATTGVFAMVCGLACPSAIALPQDQPPGQSTAERLQDALDRGRQHLENAEWQAAKQAFEEALSIQPGNQEAIEGIADANVMLNQGDLMDPLLQEQFREAELTRVEFEAAMDSATELLERGDFQQAELTVADAQVRLSRRRETISATEFTSFQDRAETLRGQIESARQVAIMDDIARREAEAAERVAEQERREREARERLITENLRRVRHLQTELRYPEALEIIDEILFMDPLNPAALVLRDSIATAQLYQEYAHVQKIKERNIPQLSLDIQRSMVPPGINLDGPGNRSVSGIMEYPEDWRALSVGRSFDTGFVETPQDAGVLQRLNNSYVPVNFQNHSFESVIGYIQQVTGETVYVDWKALEFIGVDRDTNVNLQLREVPATTALDRLLDQLGNAVDRPQWSIEDGMLVISSEEELDKNQVLVVYDIRDLLFEVPIFDNAPTLDLDSALNQGQSRQNGQGNNGGGGNDGAGSSGGSIFGGGEEEIERRDRDELVDDIVAIIQQNVDPDGWRDLGGDTGSLQELNGNLIITQTTRNHREIEGLLSQLRDIRALQINVESRFMTVASDWFERIGVDLDLYFNTNSQMTQNAMLADPNFHLSDFFDPATGQLKDPVIFGGINDTINLDPTAPPIINTIATGNATGTSDGTNITYTVGPVGTPIRNTGGWSPIQFVQDSFGLVTDLADFDPSSFAGLAANNPAAVIGVQFLDDIQVDLLIEATQADRRTINLTAPRLTFFNGQRAWVAVQTQTAFVSGLEPITGDASGAFEPTIGVISDGFVLDVEGVISADRRYVTMTVIFDFAEFLGFRESSAAEFGGAAGGGGTGGGDAAQFTGQVELPILRASQIRTTVSVPDRGTVLLGGQRQSQEIEVESGVPVLSKLPFLQRFFTNRLTSKTEQTLLILIRPEIIIQQEHEDILFPGLSDTIGAGAFMR